MELFSVIVRLKHEKRLTQSDSQRTKVSFSKHLRTQYRVVKINSMVLRRARNMVEKHNLRTLDAIQLASALNVAAALQVNPTFITGDQRLLIAAGAEGLPIDNPYNHP